MSQTATLPEKNGQAVNRLAEMERLVREEAASPPEDAVAGVHDYLGHCRGVVHIGAHVGQERGLYSALNVVWVEPQDVAYSVLCENIKNFPKQRAYQHLIADGKTYKFGLSNNAGFSSSIYDFKLHKKLWPEVGYVGAESIQSITLAELVSRYKIDLAEHDALVLDVQGAELLILQHAGDCFDRFRWVMCEVADFEAYDGGCTLTGLDEFMTGRGFVRDRLLCAATRPGIGSYYEAIYRNLRYVTATDRPQQTNLPDGKVVPCLADRMPSVSQPAALRLNLGAGNTHLDGFTNLDRKTGQEVYPLPYDDGTVDEIMASHVLEHFSHLESASVLKHWVGKLKPGGKIRLAVPDFEILAKEYLAGKPLNVQGYVMGGHTDANDRHGTIFDRESLTELMMACGLERIGAWKSDVVDCASLPISLNLQGFKPSSDVREMKNVRAVYSTPRFGPLQHCRCIERAVQQLRFESKGGASCFWHQMLSVLMEEAIADEGCEYVLTMDFDTVFGAADILELYRLMLACPEADAIFPVQSKRGCTEALFSLTDGSGRLKAMISEADLERQLLPANTGHFGLTMFRAESLRKFQRPWMLPTPNRDGKWDDGQIDADITFWMRFKDAGFNCFLAPRVVVGHLQEIVTWPGKDLKPVHQKPADYDKDGIPAEVIR